MEYEKMKEWLDLWVEDFKRIREHKNFNNQISCCIGYSDVITVTGIGMIADIMKIQLKEEQINNSEFGFNYEYSFEYAGATFVSYERERLEKHVPV